MFRFYNLPPRKPKTYKPTNRDKPKIDPLVFATWALVLTTFFLVVATGLLYWITRDIYIEAVGQSEHTRKYVERSDSINREAIALTKQSLDLAIKQMELSQKGFKIENRPYLNVKDFMFSKLEEGKYFKIGATIFNVGKIPALKVKMRHDFELHSIFYYENISIEGIPEKTMDGISPSGSTMIFKDFSKMPFSKSQYELINSGELFLYYYGKISYTDVFGGDYFTTFCIICNLNNPPAYLYNSTFNEIK